MPSGRNSGLSFHGSPHLAQTNGNGLLDIQNQLNRSESDSISPNSKSSMMFWCSVAVPVDFPLKWW